MKPYTTKCPDGSVKLKSLRQSKILELIKNNVFVTQEELQQKLVESGFDVTQATVSRDIRELGIVKSDGNDGEYKYRVGNERDRADTAGKFSVILRQAISSVDAANNLIVVKTYVGMGSAAGAAIDSMDLDGVLGTLAGDDTLLIIAKGNGEADTIKKKIIDLID